MRTPWHLPLQFVGLAALLYWMFTGPYYNPPQKTSCTKIERGLYQGNCPPLGSSHQR